MLADLLLDIEQAIHSDRSYLDLVLKRVHDRLDLTFKLRFSSLVWLISGAVLLRLLLGLEDRVTLLAQLCEVAIAPVELVSFEVVLFNHHLRCRAFKVNHRAEVIALAEGERPRSIASDRMSAM